MIFQRSMHTAPPTVKNRKRPTILQEMVRARKTPVEMSHDHHAFENSLEMRIVNLAV